MHLARIDLEIQMKKLYFVHAACQQQALNHQENNLVINYVQQIKPDRLK